MHEHLSSPAEDPPEPAAAQQPRISAGCAPLLALIALGWVLWQWLNWPNVEELVNKRPTDTAFMALYRQRAVDRAEEPTVRWRWVQYGEISPHLKRAVLVAEDIGFFWHHGFATAEIKAAIESAVESGTAPRGASTITQQLAKNLWLSPSRNPLRKLKEGALTIQLEKYLDKRRILTVYLNVVEFGVGIYGAEAAAQHYFGKSARFLDEHEAALLAASLPRPKTWHAGVQSPAYLRRVGRIEEWARQTKTLDRYF